MTRVHVHVEGDHIEKLTRPSRRFAGISELVWNAMDAEASSVTISVQESELGGVGRVVVVDDGHGITAEDAQRYFGALGGSWKRVAPGRKSRHNLRVLHGSEGQGRWRAFGVGSLIEWSSVAEVDGQAQAITITGNADSLTDFEVSDPAPTDRDTGTRVQIDNIRPEALGLLGEKVIETLTAEFALYLENYNVVVKYRGTQLDPAAVQETQRHHCRTDRE